jgi:hypothetical protein
VGTLRDTAHISLDGKRLKIEFGEPLEESVRTVHTVLKRIAQSSGQPVTYDEKPGYRAHANLTATVRNLAPSMPKEDRERLTSLIGQVFRRTGAAVCLHKADPHTKADPVWFVANVLPESLVVVSSYVGGRSAGAAGSPPSGFSEKDFLSRSERKLLPEEVGETLPAGEVTLTVTEPKRRQRRSPTLTEEQKRRKATALEPYHEKVRAKHAELTEQIYELVATSQVPLTPPEAAILINKEYDAEWHETTVRGILGQLRDAGRLTSRPETRAERLVRGGGRSPRAKSPAVWFVPGQDAERTRLPDGITPLRTALDWAAERKLEKQSNADKVYTALDVPNRPETREYAPRSLGQITQATGLSPTTARAVLNHLVNEGKVFYHPKHKYWAPMHRVTSTTLAKYGSRKEKAQPAPAPAPAPEAPSKPEAAPDIAALVHAEVTRALTTLQQPPVPARMMLLEELTEVRAERDELRLENTKLREAIGHLEAALSTLQR